MSPRDSVRAGRALPRKTLGRKRRLRFAYDPRLLEAVPVGVSREFKGQAIWVSLLCLRFTSLCPVTGQPDWAELDLSYIPDRRLVESKSLKEYLHGFRMHGDFHEDVCRVIVDDLARLLAPRYLELIGRFDARGSIAIWPYVQYSKPGDAEAAEILRHRRVNHRPGERSPQGERGS